MTPNQYTSGPPSEEKILEGYQLYIILPIQISEICNSMSVVCVDRYSSFLLNITQTGGTLINFHFREFKQMISSKAINNCNFIITLCISKNKSYMKILLKR